MTELERDHLLAECLEGYHRRRARGEAPAPGDYRDQLGDHFPEFVELLAAESAIDEAMAPPAPTEFPVAFGEYTLLREIGRGAVGVVYEAIQRPLGRKVALKVLRTGFDTDEKALERFSREARACAQIRHDNLVTLYGSGEFEGRPFYAMALLPGQPLSALIKAGEAPKGKPLFEGLAGIADALDALHRAGIVHRDVKPSNIVVEPSGRMVLTDFGLARTALSVTLTGTGEALGTPLYMSPEQMLGQRDEIDGRSDVYGLGATLYEAVAGRPPFKSDDLRELMRMILQGGAKSLEVSAPGTPKGVAHVAMKALERKRGDRHESAAMLRDELLRLARGEDPVHRPVSAVTHWIRENRSIWVPTAAGVLFAVGAFLWWSHRPGRIAIVDTIPAGAQITVNGTLVTSLPYDAWLPPGTYHITVKREHFREWKDTVELTPRREYVQHSVPLVPADATGYEIFLGAIHQELALPANEPSLVRSGGDLEVVLAWPRGDVRLVDLATYRMDFSAEDMEGDAAVLEFRRGDEVLHRNAAFSPRKTGDVLADLPSEVVDRLRVGDTVKWGVSYPSGRTTQRFTAEFTVVAESPGLARDLGRAAEILRFDPDHHLPEIRAFVFLKHGLYTAAWQETQPSLNRDGPPPTVGLTAALLEAIRRAGLRPPDRPAKTDDIQHWDTSDTPYGYDAIMLWHAFPEKERDAYLAARNATMPR